MASEGGVCWRTNSRKPRKNQKVKKTSGTPTKRTSIHQVGSMCGVVCVSERRR